MEYNPYYYMFPFGYPPNACYYPPPTSNNPKNQVGVVDLDNQHNSPNNSPPSTQANNHKPQKKARITKDLRVGQESSSQYLQERRNYRRRRSGLKKSYFCQIQKCNKKYSSNMALRNHLRDFHGIRMRIRIKKQSQ